MTSSQNHNKDKLKKKILGDASIGLNLYTDILEFGNTYVILFCHKIQYIISTLEQWWDFIEYLGKQEPVR